MKLKDKKTEATVKEMKSFTRKMTSSADKAKGFLQKAGIITEKGNLRKPYKHSVRKH